MANLDYVDYFDSAEKLEYTWGQILKDNLDPDENDDEGGN